MAGHAGPARLDGVGDLGNGAQVELLDLASQVGLGHREALADESALFLLLFSLIDPQQPEIHPALARPVEDRGFQGLGAHHRAVDLLVGEPFQERDDVLVLDLEGLDGRVGALLDDRAERFGCGDRRGAPEGQILRLGDDVLGGVGGMPVDREGEAQGIPAGDGSVLAKAVGVLDLTEVGSRLAVDGIHEELLGLFAVVPRHLLPSIPIRKRFGEER